MHYILYTVFCTYPARNAAVVPLQHPQRPDHPQGGSIGMTLRLNMSELMAMNMEMAMVGGCCSFCRCGLVEDVDGHDDERMMMLMMMMMMMEKISVRM